MNENLDLEKILEGCPEGTEFYSPLFGELKLKHIYGNGSHTIAMICVKMNRRYMFNRAGKYEMIEMECSDSWGNYYFSDECLLFPSKEQRDWSKFERFWDKSKKEKFDVNTLQGNNISNIDKLKKISTPAEENWFKIAEEWKNEDK